MLQLRQNSGVCNELHKNPAVPRDFSCIDSGIAIKNPVFTPKNTGFYTMPVSP